MKRIYVLIFSVLLVVSSAFGARLDSYKGKIKDGYNFWLYQPDDTTETKPLIVFLHGASLCGTNLNRVKRYGTIDAIERGRNIDAYVVAPQSTVGGWKPSKVMDVIKWVENECKVDTNRIYVVGMSLGGYGTLDVASTYPDKIAAAIGICGGATTATQGDLNRLPLWIVHGTADRAVTVKQSDKVVDAMKKRDPDTPRLIYDRIPGMNHSRPARIFYLPDIYEWLFMHRLDEPERPLHTTVHITDSLLRTAYTGLSRKSSR